MQNGARPRLQPEEVPAGDEKPVKRVLPPCSGLYEIFYGEETDLRKESESIRTARERQALSICHHCPYIGKCLTLALVKQEEFGIWGGMTPQERKRFSEWLHDEGIKPFYGMNLPKLIGQFREQDEIPRNPGDYGPRLEPRSIGGGRASQGRSGSGRVVAIGNRTVAQAGQGSKYRAAAAQGRQPGVQGSGPRASSVVARPQNPKNR